MLEERTSRSRRGAAVSVPEGVQKDIQVVQRMVEYRDTRLPSGAVLIQSRREKMKPLPYRINDTSERGKFILQFPFNLLPDGNSKAA
ncbi:MULTISPECIES: hypothetical protein [unclassified Streptomyces]|uniref:hypothetical protein n=1 Tax=unclassified Streptomyces TaxID=2593676 RepID=UPI003829355D